MPRDFVGPDVITSSTQANSTDDSSHESDTWESFGAPSEIVLGVCQKLSVIGRSKGSAGNNSKLGAGSRGVRPDLTDLSHDDIGVCQ